ncbi:bola-like protein [Pholiota conissans]|uniref:Bola-like protein n=1 Tax=Pholiota conissans TaxID=109636 RepID=A0A9P6D321_9AGAR|nr:bola-like protein [Pholiota conissans]
MFSLARRLLPAAHSVRTFSATALPRNASSSPKADLLEGEQLISKKLIEKFTPSQLQVQDISGGCGSFYSITIASETFKGLPIVKQHKLVTETLKKEIEGIHGLQIKTIAQ